MFRIKKIIRALIIPMGTVFLLPIILSLLNVFGLKTFNLSILIIMMIATLISSYLLGRVTEERGYINGLLMGISLSLILFILSLLFKNHYMINSLIYYAIIILCSTIGSMAGIQKKIDRK